MTLERDENGLGFTIAGGRGSTPYKGNDQVCVVINVTTSFVDILNDYGPLSSPLSLSKSHKVQTNFMRAAEDANCEILNMSFFFQ